VTSYPFHTEPMAHQRRALKRIIRAGGSQLLACDPGTGKALDVSTPILTRRGWVTMGDVVTGDEVYAPDGTYTLVTKAHDAYDADAVELSFSSGESIIADLDHLWVTQTRNDRRQSRPASVRNTRQIVATLERSGGGANHSIRKADELHGHDGSEVDVPFGFYTLGVWLGDGNSYDSGVTLNHDDAPHILRRMGHAVTAWPSTESDTCRTYGIDGYHIDGYHAVLRELDLLRNKHIKPEWIYRSSLQQRLDLLKGLVDTDGHRGKSLMEVTFTNRNLADRLTELLVTLGESPSCYEGRAMIDGIDMGPKWRVTWTPRLSEPASLPRKRWGADTPRQGERLDNHYVTGATPVGVRRVRCLTVDHPTAMYLVGRTLIPTHNTKISIDYAGMLAMARGRAVVFVTAPLSAIDTWGDEVDRHLPPNIRREVHILSDGSVLEKADEIKRIGRELPEGSKDDPLLVMVVVNLDVFSSNRRVKGTKSVTTRGRMIAAVRTVGWDLGIVDESHRIKNHASNVGRALGMLSQDIPNRLALTGTVAPHSPLDVYGQMQWVDQTLLPNWATFRNTYAISKGPWGTQIVGYRALDHLSHLLRKHVFVAKKRDCLDLPPVTDATIHVELMAKERRVYNEVAHDAVAMLDGTKVLAPRAIQKWMMLRQVTSGFLNENVDEMDTALVHELGDTKMRAAVDKVEDLVAASGEKVVVFAHFVRDVKTAHERLTKRLGCPVEMIYGDTPNDERRAIRKRFLNHDGPMVVVAQMRTVSLSVNEFVAAAHAVFLSFSERHDDYIQARDRLDRNGQTRPVTIWHVVARNTLDQAMLDAYSKKGTLEDAVLAEARRMAGETA